MSFSQKELELLKKSLVFIQVDIKKYSKYREETATPEIEKALHQVITAKKDHVSLIKTILNRNSKGEG